MGVAFNKKKLFRRGSLAARLRLTSVTLLSGLGASALAFAGVNVGFPVVREQKDRTKVVKTNTISKNTSPTTSVINDTRETLSFLIEETKSLFIENQDREKDRQNSLGKGISNLRGRIDSKDPRDVLIAQLFHFRDEMELYLRQIDAMKEIVEELKAELNDVANMKLNKKLREEVNEIAKDLLSTKKKLPLLEISIFKTIRKINSLISEAYALYD